MIVYIIWNVYMRNIFENVNMKVKWKFITPRVVKRILFEKSESFAFSLFSKVTHKFIKQNV